MAKNTKRTVGADGAAEKYVPGVCNIDAGGRRKRAAFGIVLLAATMGFWYYLKFVLSAGLVLKTILFIPALLAFMGFWQAKLHFCMGNARRKQYEIGGAATPVTDEASQRRDAQRAGQVFFYATVSAIVLTVILMLA